MLNQVAYTGRITKDAVTRTVGDKKVSNFTVAVDRDYKNGENERPTDFFPVVAWNLPDWLIEKCLLKGKGVTVTGRNQSRKWSDNEGKDIYAIELVSDNIYPVEFPKKEA